MGKLIMTALVLAILVTDGTRPIPLRFNHVSQSPITGTVNF